VSRESIVFCIGALAASLALCAVGFRLAALPKEALEASRRPVSAERLPDIQVGGGFGKVSVLELVGYYLENPPAAPEAGAASPAVKRFRGC
jgi:hypothetical protein